MQAAECCSDYVISFHYVSRGHMYALYNSIYHTRVYGVTDDAQKRVELRRAQRGDHDGDGPTLIEELRESAQESARVSIVMSIESIRLLVAATI